MHRLLLLFLLACLLAGSAAAAATLKRDIPYGSTTDSLLLLNASVPDSAGLHPVVIVLHGGGWASGDRQAKDISMATDAFTSSSFTWFSVEYRLAPKHRWPAAIDDVNAAIRWVKHHAREFKGDPNRIALFGYSAGGHLACLAATTATPASGTQVQAVACFSPPTDLELDLPQRQGLSKSLQMLLDHPQQPIDPAIRAQLHAMSPINHIHPGLPPFLIIHGDKDKSVLHEDTLNFIAKLKANHVPAELIVIPGGQHRLRDWIHIKPDYLNRLTMWLGAKLQAAR